MNTFKYTLVASVAILSYSCIAQQATTLDSLKVLGKTEIKDYLDVDRDVHLKDSLRIDKNLDVKGATKIKGEIVVKGDSKLKGKTTMTGKAVMKGNAVVHGNLKVKSFEDLSLNYERMSLIKPNGKIEVSTNVRSTSSHALDINGDFRTTGESDFGGDVKLGHLQDMTLAPGETRMLNIENDGTVRAGIRMPRPEALCGGYGVPTIPFTTIEGSGNILLCAFNLGIGTTSPEYKLDVDGGARFKDFIKIGTNSLYMLEPNTNTGDTYGSGFPIISGSNHEIFSTNGDLEIQSNFASQLGNTTINRNAGSVSVGTDPVSGVKMLVRGTDQVALCVRTDNPGNWGHGVKVLTNKPESKVFSSYHYGNNNDLFYVTGAGNMYVSNQIGIGTETPLGQMQLEDIYSANGKNLVVGNDSYLSDVDKTNTLGIIGLADNSQGRLQLGTSTNYIVGANGSVGITDNQYWTPSGNYNLEVNGDIKCKAVKVTLDNWEDRVFYADYDLMTLEQVHQFIDNNGHLPNVPSEQEVTTDGVDLGTMDAILLRKIEELTLYILEQESRIKSLEEQHTATK